MANWLSGYTTRRKITIDKSKIDSDLTDFPVLVKLTSSNFDFSKANSDGYDIRFTSADGTTLLKYERERHDASNQVAEYWVKIPSVSSSADTEFYIYYGNSSASDGANPTNVWDSNFKGVWHLKETSGTQYDSTFNGNNGTPYGGVIQGTTGKIDGADSFDGSNDYVKVSDSDSLDFSSSIDFTIEYWVNTTQNPSSSWPMLVRKQQTSPSRQGYNFYLEQGAGGKLGFDIFVGGTIYGPVLSTTAINNGVWHYVVAQRQGSNLLIFIDGNYNNQTSGSSADLSNTGPLQMGGGVSDIWYNGLIDEVRVSNTSRSAAWIKASYNSGNNSLVSYGSEEGMDNAVFFGCNF